MLQTNATILIKKEAGAVRTTVTEIPNHRLQTILVDSSYKAGYSTHVESEDGTVSSI